MVPQPREEPQNDHTPSSTPEPPVYQKPDLGHVVDTLRRQVSGVHRAIDAFEKAKNVPPESLDYEVCL